MPITNYKLLITNPAWDVIVIAFFILAGFFYGVASGKRRLLSVLLAAYLAAFIFENIRFLASAVLSKTPLEVLVIRLASFFVILVPASLLVGRIVGRRDWGEKIWWQIFMLSFLEVGLLVSLAFHFLPAREIFEFSPLVENLFAGENAFLTWLLLPLLALWITSL